MTDYLARLSDDAIRDRGSGYCECDGRCGVSHAPAGEPPILRRHRCHGHHGLWRPGQPLMQLVVGDVGEGRARCRLLLCPDCATRGAAQ